MMSEHAPNSLLADVALAAQQLGAQVAAIGAGLLGTAESCTGGLIASALTGMPGSSRWFSRAHVVYSNRAKMEMLGVSADVLLRHGAVSEAVAREMALGALRSDELLLALAVTGIAGPEGGLPGKPVGTVCFGWALRWPGLHDMPLVLTETRHVEGDRSEVRARTALHALCRASQLLAEQGRDRPLAG